MLSKSGNREEALKYSLLTIHFADSLLKVRGYDEKVIFSLKAGGMWNYYLHSYDLSSPRLIDSAISG